MKNHLWDLRWSFYTTQQTRGSRHPLLLCHQHGETRNSPHIPLFCSDMSANRCSKIVLLFLNFHSCTSLQQGFNFMANCRWRIKGNCCVWVLLILGFVITGGRHASGMVVWQ